MMIHGINILDLAELATCVGVLAMLGAHSVTSHREHRRIERKANSPSVIRVETHLEGPQSWADMLRQMDALTDSTDKEEANE